MKTIFTVCAFFLTIFSFGQTNFRSGLTNLDSYFYDLVQMNDGSYVCVGADYSSTDNTNGVSIARFNAQGQLLISKSLVPGSYDEAVEGIAIIKTSDGGVAVSGEINDTICLLKFDANLLLTWHKQLASDIEYYSYGARLTQTSDGGYMVTGAFGSDYNGDTHEVGTVIKTNSTGDVTWSKQFFDFSINLYEDRNILDVIPSDGNYLLLANTYSENNTDGYDSTYIIKINSSGTIIWSKFISLNGLLDQTPISVISTSDGGYMVCGYVDRNVAFDGFVYTVSQAMLIKLNSDGNVVWSRASNTPYNYDTYGYEVKEDKDGGFIVAGELDSADAGSDYVDRAYFFKVNSSGNLLWTKVITSDATYEYPFSIVPTSDGGFAAAGESYSENLEDGTYNYDRGVLYKFGSDYNICGSNGSYGVLSDIQATTIAKSVATYSLNTTGYSTTITVKTAGTGLNLCNTLPLRLLSFNASLQNKSVNIEWKTANELNTDHFVVERSSNRTAFASLQTVGAKGNSSNVQTYAITDLQPLFGTSYYRLKQVDKDGSFTYSNIVSVTVSANGTIVISPNPVQNTIRVLVQSSVQSQTTFQVTDMTGKTLASQVTNVNAGTSTVLIPAASLSKGLYILKVIQNGSAQSIRFIKE